MARRRSHDRSTLNLRLWEWTGTALLNLLVLTLVAAYLSPIVYMLFTAVKEDNQFNDIDAPIWPAQPVTYAYQGARYVIYKVPTEQGMREWALVEPHRQESSFVDPQHPEAGLIAWKGQWRTLDKVYQVSISLGSFEFLWRVMDLPRLLTNTLIVTALSEIGVLLSSIAVAYGFARFRIPHGKALFFLMIATIIIPDKITLIPTYFIFVKVLGWNGTWLPLVVPHFFGNAILIFLLRQNFKVIPRELDEAAMLDGAGPLRTLVSVILPNCLPAVATVALLHFFYAWNEAQVAGLYLGINPDLYTISFGVQNYQSRFPPPNALQASALLAMAVPVLVLFLAQRFFMRDVVVTGAEKPIAERKDRRSVDRDPARRP